MFLEDVVTPGNLQRLFWFIVIYLPISVAGYVVNWTMIHDHNLVPWIFFDVGLGLVFLALVVWARRKRAAVRWKRHLVLVYYLYILVSMDGYYFSLHEQVGDNAAFMLGVLMAGVLFVLPPQQFLPIQLGNYAVFILLVSRMDGAGLEETAVTFFGATDAVILACLASWFLFFREWKNHERSRQLEEVNRKLAKANDLLAERNEELREWMAMAAHDLRGPLAASSGLSEVLRDEPEWKREPYAGVLKEMGEMSDGMLALVERMLEAHEAEHEERHGKKGAVDVVKVTKECVERIQRAARGKGIRLEMPESDPVVIPTDGGAVAQILDNLLSNAVKYSPAGSRVEVEVSRRETGCVMEVRDEGPGVPEEEREAIFGKFRRGRNQPTDGEPSTGLGLFIVRRVTESLGGRVDCQPGERRGSVFRVVLPVE